MRRFDCSLQARFDTGAFRNIGLMVWSDDTLDYFAVRGEEAHARTMNERIADCRQSGQVIRDFVQYFLEWHGGHFYSMARPEAVDADFPQDAVRQIASRWDLDLVVPAPARTPVDPAVVRELMEATEGGADLAIRGPSTRATDRAFVLGFGALGDTVVFAYLPFPYGFSPFSRGRFYVDSVEEVEGHWQVRCRDAFRREPGELTVEVRPIADPDVRLAVAAFKDLLDDDQRRLIMERLHALADPNVV